MDQTILYKMGKIKTSVPDNFREGQNTSGKIKTGDSQNALIWVMVLIGALICVSVCLMRYRNKEAKKDER